MSARIYYKLSIIFMQMIIIIYSTYNSFVQTFKTLQSTFNQVQWHQIQLKLVLNGNKSLPVVIPTMKTINKAEIEMVNSF